MHPNPRVRVQQQQRICRRADHSDAYTFFNLLTSPALLDRVESLLPEHRERLFPPTETLSLFLWQALSADRSCQRAVNDASVKRLIGGLPVCSTHTGGYCRARADQKMVTDLFKKERSLTDDISLAHRRGPALRHTAVDVAKQGREIGRQDRLRIHVGVHAGFPGPGGAAVGQERAGRREIREQVPGYLGSE